MVYKMNESIIMIQAEAINPIQTNVVFWSHDRGTAKLRMKLVRKNGIPQSLPEGTTVPIRLIFKSATAEGGYGKHDYLATIEDRVNGIVSIVLEDNILGYVGKVEGSVYIDFPNDRSLDTAGRFTFYIKRSPIDDSTPELEDYYFNGFSQTIDKIEKILADGKQEIEQKIAESETQIDAKVKDTNDKITKANQDVATLNTNIDKANNRIDQTNQQISDLGKLKKMYSNSIDFGDYDYSGNPNLLSKLSYDLVVNQNGSVGTVSQGENSFKYNKTTKDVDGSVALYYKAGGRANWLPSNKRIVMTVKLRAGVGYIPADGRKLLIRYRYIDNGTSKIPVDLQVNSASLTQEWQEFTVTGTTQTFSQQANDPWVQFYVQMGILGEIEMSYDIKIEEGSTATPYQPNLLDAPYYLSKVPLGENIANKSVTFPIKTSAYAVYDYKNIDNFIVGEKYVLTIKATKPATQIFNVRNTPNYTFGAMKPVEGLTDIWVLEFTPTSIDDASPSNLQIYQVPNDTKGACQIDWLKIEKSDTRTPNISQFKYFGEGLKDSNNPNDYSWDITPEYTEKGLNDSVSLTEPETVLGLKNFEDGLQIAGKEVATVPEDTGWVNLTAINGHSWNKQGQIRRIGKLVMFRGSLKGSTLSTQDFCTIPEGFRPSNPTDNYEYQFLLPPQSSNTLDNGGMAYIRPNGVCGLPSFRGTVNLFLAPIQYYID
ncbi:BppU family phage baseplate upper protein [Enterococcus faecium]|uniref:BppU family phage baseplate upper protein n=1 Tax=Enterococcus faecium TaxID=1352 RepID=UPI002433CD3E|nr:BppU family phage baseplate upper protein [Enterococcus faecium]